MTENQRLKILMDELNFKSQAAFAKALNITPGGLSDVLRQKGGIGVSDKIKRTLERSYSVNIEWLEKGTGNAIFPDKTLNSPNQTYYEPPKSYMQKISEFLNQDRNDDSQIEITPVYNQHITSEKVSGLKEGRMPDELLLDGAFKECDLVIRHTDPAMNGFMNKNSFMGIKQLTEVSYRRRIIPGKAYVIVLENYVIERFLHPGKEKDLLLRSVDRELNPDFEISFDEIIELWLIKAWKPMFEAELV